MNEVTDFGFRKVPEPEKKRLVGRVFSSVAGKYDLMNDLMSLGLHRLWKKFAVTVSGVRPGHRVLDIAGGTGDLALAFRPARGPHRGSLAHRHQRCHARARARPAPRRRGARAHGAVRRRSAPLPLGSFRLRQRRLRPAQHDAQGNGVAEMHRVLKPGGRLLVLEFSRVWAPLSPAYDLYSFKVLPWLGEKIAHDAESYRYLAESIRVHPDQETLKAMMERIGFHRVDYYNLTAGVVALHLGRKL